VFHSSASDLVPGTGAVGNVYLWDATTGATTLLSRPDAGGFASTASASPWISDDGSQVVFESGGDLVAGEGPGLVHWRRDTGQLEVLATPDQGTWWGSPWIASSDGRYGAVRTSTPGAETTLLTIVDLQTSASIGSCSFDGPAKSAAGELSHDGSVLAVTLSAEDVPSPLEQRSRRCDTATGAVKDLGVWTDAVDLTRDGQLTVIVQPFTPTRISASLHEQVRVWTASAKGSSAFTTRPRSDAETDLRVALSGDGGVVAYEADSVNVLELHPSGNVDIYLWDRIISP
jgi:WD40 repeat protein